MWQEYVSLAYAFAIAACVAVLSWRWAWRWWKYRDRARLAREPRCETCGYIIARGSPVICPECGSDVREKGIVTPRTLPAIGWGPVCVLVALVAIPVGVALGRAVEEKQPFGWEYLVLRWVYLGPDERREDLRYCFVVEAGGAGRYFGKRPQQVGVFQDSPQHPNTGGKALFVMARDLRTRRLDGARGIEEGTFSEETADRFVRTVAPRAPRDETKQVAAKVHANVVAILNGDFPSYNTATDYPQPRTEVRYSLSKRARLGAAVVCCTLVAAVAETLLCRIASWRRRERRVKWRQAAHEMALRETA